MESVIYLKQYFGCPDQPPPGLDVNVYKKTNNVFPKKMLEKICWDLLSIDRNTETFHRSKNDVRNRVNIKYF